jgi:hypothetical protein
VPVVVENNELPLDKWKAAPKAALPVNDLSEAALNHLKVAVHSILRIAFAGYAIHCYDDVLKS